MQRLLILAWLLMGISSFAAATSGTEDDKNKNVQAKKEATEANGLIAQPWYRPHHAIGQFAAGQGMGALGVGYTTARGHIDIDVLAGYVPKKYSITPMGVFTGKATYTPFSIPVGTTRFQVRPLSVGGFVSYTASKGLNSSRDDKYYKGYYWWSSHTRIGGFVGGRVAYELPSKANGQPRTASLYYELGSNDLYLTSMWSNHDALKWHDILTLGFGVKVDL
jgi:hypothetical protein